MENSNLAEVSNIGLVKSSCKDQIMTKTKESGRSIENGTQVKFYFQKLLHYDYLLMLLNSVNIILTILYYDTDYSGDSSDQAFLMLYTMSGFLCFTIIITFHRYKAKIQLLISQMQVSKYETLWSSGILLDMSIEILVLMMQPYPFLNNLTIITRNIYNKYVFEFKVNYILVILGFFRLFIVFRVFLLRTSYMNPRASRNCRMYGCKASYVFAIKCLFKDTPMFLMGIVFFVSIFVFALGLRISERNLTIQDLRHPGVLYAQDLQNLNNSIWLTIITMTTVGYGDYFPRTLIGRLIDVILVIWGIFIVSLMVVVLTNALDMDSNQSRALIVLNRLQAKKIIKEKAANLISTTFRKRQLIKSFNREPNKIKKQELKTKIKEINIKLNNFSKEFESVNRQIRSMYELDNVYEQMTRQFEFINDEITFLTDNQHETIKNLRQYLRTQKRSNKN